MRYHSERPFVCDHAGCNAKFVTNALLGKHLQNHGERNYECHICSKAFFTRHILYNHLKGVHPEKEFVCELCPFTNKRRDNLRAHYFRAHQELTKEDVLEMMPSIEKRRDYNSLGRPLNSKSKRLTVNEMQELIQFKSANG